MPQSDLPALIRSPYGRGMRNNELPDGAADGFGHPRLLGPIITQVDFVGGLIARPATEEHC